MTRILIGLLFLLGMGFLRPNVHAEIDCYVQNKIYVQVQDILINEDGIFLIAEKNLISVNALYKDQYGIYIETAFCDEESHGSKCHYCEGCFKWNCPRRCKCN